MRVIAAGRLSEEEIATIIDVVGRGGVICFPTDTAYGLGVDPGNTSAVDRLFAIKGRPSDKPILLLVDSVEMARKQSRETALFEELAGKFWPGPITMVVSAVPDLSERVTAGSGTVGIRWPAAPLATRLVGRLGHPLTATSANLSGEAPARSATEAVDQLADRVDLVIDGGPSPDTSLSTLLDLTKDPPQLLREGPLSYGDLADFLQGRLRRVSA